MLHVNFLARLEGRTVGIADRHIPIIVLNGKLNNILPIGGTTLCLLTILQMKVRGVCGSGTPAQSTGNPIQSLVLL
jgi:hypothetical protein